MDAFIAKMEELAAKCETDVDDLEDELLAMFRAEQTRSELFSKIVTDVAKALGQKRGETTHDLGEKVKKLRDEFERMKHS
jgi:hypothetical protein